MFMNQKQYFVSFMLAKKKKFLNSIIERIEFSMTTNEPYLLSQW